jgi:hypothetical protein
MYQEYHSPVCAMDSLLGRCKAGELQLLLQPLLQAMVYMGKEKTDKV